MTRKKKKTTQVTTPPTSPTSTKGIIAPASSMPKRAISHVPAVALLIDGENVVAPDLIAHILVEAGKMGGVTTRYVYGNWAAPSMQSWKKQLVHYGLEPMGNRSGRNATDIALVIGAMDLFYQGIKHFCFVTGDSDYVPLVQRLRQSECTVLVIGTAAVSAALKDACSLFVPTDHLLPQISSISPVPSLLPSSSIPTSFQTSELSTMLTDAYLVASQKSDTGWVLLSILGLTLRECHSGFEATYGKKNLSELIKQYPNCFETRKRQIGKGETEEVRLRC